MGAWVQRRAAYILLAAERDRCLFCEWVPTGRRDRVEQILLHVHEVHPEEIPVSRPVKTVDPGEAL